MATYIIWFLLGLLMLAVEMATGTFYLLVMGIALGTGGVIALLGWSLPIQITVCAIVGIIGTIILRRSKITGHEALETQSLDIGQPVKVIQTHENGMLRVTYRGAEWDAELLAANSPSDQPLFIHTIRGSTLILSQQKPTP